MIRERRFKRFIVFIWTAYEAGGGFNDYSGDFDYIKQALIHIKKCKYGDDAQIFDCKERKLINAGK